MRDINKLLSMLTYKRPHGSETEQEFIDQFIMPLAGHANVQTHYCDTAGNIYVSTDTTSNTLFTAHVDTVHNKDGRQVVTCDRNINIAYLGDETSNCLGADDTAGMWLMLEMIDAGVPGTYVFFRGEERGGIGSRHAAQHNAEFFAGFDRAVAFDRRGTGDVITHQAGGRCCSDVFADALANQLTAHNVTYAPCSGGVFTDTANLTGLIGECTNLSCGYDSEHSAHESLDVEHLLHMLDALINVNWEYLPTARKPGDVDPADYSYNYGGSWFRDYDPVGSGYLPTDDVMGMNFKQLKAWILKSEVEDVAEVIYDLVDRVIMYQEEQVSYDDLNHAIGWQ